MIFEKFGSAGLKVAESDGRARRAGTVIDNIVLAKRTIGQWDHSDLRGRALNEPYWLGICSAQAVQLCAVSSVRHVFDPKPDRILAQAVGRLVHVLGVVNGGC